MTKITRLLAVAVLAAAPLAAAPGALAQPGQVDHTTHGKAAEAPARDAKPEGIGDQICKIAPWLCGRR